MALLFFRDNSIERPHKSTFFTRPLLENRNETRAVSSTKIRAKDNTMGKDKVSDAPTVPAGKKQQQPAAKSAVPPKKQPPATPAAAAVSKKKKKKATFNNFDTYIRAVLRSGPQADLGTTKETISVLDGLIKDQFTTVTKQAGLLCTKKKKQTLGVKEVQAAFELTVGSEMYKTISSRIHEAVTKYIGAAD